MYGVKGYFGLISCFSSAENSLIYGLNKYLFPVIAIRSLEQ